MRIKGVYKSTCDKNGIIIQYKARFVAQGFIQIEGLIYNEAYCSVATFTTTRSVALSATIEYYLHLVDVETAFLNCELMEEMNVVPPDG